VGASANLPPLNAVNLPVINGIFNVRLGDTVLPNMRALPSTAFNSARVVLRVWFDDGAHGRQLLLPDQPITSVAHSDHDHGPNMNWSLLDNAGTNPPGHFLGTTDFVPLELRANNARALRIEPTGNTPNLVGGSEANGVEPGVVGATIGGGESNRAMTSHTTVGGGYLNSALGDGSTIVGGWANDAPGLRATIGGGDGNLAGGWGPTVPGGSGNSAVGDYGFAPGAAARAAHTATFVWSSTPGSEFAAARKSARKLISTGELRRRVTRGR